MFLLNSPLLAKEHYSRDVMMANHQDVVMSVIELVEDITPKTLVDHIVVFSMDNNTMKVSAHQMISGSTHRPPAELINFVFTKMGQKMQDDLLQHNEQIVHVVHVGIASHQDDDDKVIMIDSLTADLKDYRSILAITYSEGEHNMVGAFEIHPNEADQHLCHGELVESFLNGALGKE